MSPSEFWVQTPRSFVAILEGAARAAKRRHDAQVVLAWHTAAFSGAAQAGKLKKLDHYLERPKVRRIQTPSEMLAVLQGLKARGAKMTFKQLN